MCEAPDLELVGNKSIWQRPWLLVVAFWFVFGILESAKMVFAMRMRGMSVSWWASLAFNLPWWLVWAALVPIVVLLCRRLERVPRASRWRWQAIHIPVGVVLCTVHLLVIGLQTYALRPPVRRTFAQHTWDLADAYFMLDLLTYAGIVAACVAWSAYRRYRHEHAEALRLAVRTTELERQVTDARLAMLRMELDPHFLFNTLNSVAGLVRRGDDERAVTMLADLGALLRTTLEDGRRLDVTLADELAVIERYLAIEGVRFEDRLVVEYAITPEARRAVVPAMILQPLVENALRHGIAHCVGRGRLEIDAHREGGDLALQVTDSGPGFVESADGSGRGVGLANTRSRLSTRYGERATLEVMRADTGKVLIRIPFETTLPGAKTP